MDFDLFRGSIIIFLYNVSFPLLRRIGHNGAKQGTRYIGQSNGETVLCVYQIPISWQYVIVVFPIHHTNHF